MLPMTVLGMLLVLPSSGGLVTRIPTLCAVPFSPLRASPLAMSAHRDFAAEEDDADMATVVPSRRRGGPLAKAWRGAVATLAVCAAGLVGGHHGGPAPAWAADAAVAQAPAARTLNAAQRKRLKLAFKAKLAKVPVFMVTNDGGSPFLNQLSTGDQSALMFLFPAEAERMLNGVLKAPNGAASGAKVLATNLDRAFRLARLQPLPSGLRDQVTNRELTMVWQFMPHAAETRSAQLVLAKSGKLSAPSVPAYMVDGLVVTKRGKEVRPLFLCKRDCDAALAMLQAQAQAAGEEAPGGKIIVYDALALLLQLALDIEEGDASVAKELDYLEIVPPSESIDFRDELKAGKAKRPAKIVPPQHHR